MVKEKLLELISNENHFTIDKFVLKYAKESKLTLNDLILLIYLLNGKDNEIFNCKKILEDLDFNEKELFDSISTLKEKKLLSIEMQKNESGILDEVINVKSFYEIMISNLINNNVGDANKNDIFDIFESEFGRTLSPMEYDIINNWLESKIPKDLIVKALKEAVYNGVGNLRYIDKILYEWNKKGIKSINDLEDKNKKEDSNKDNIYYEDDWLNEN